MEKDFVLALINSFLLCFLCYQGCHPDSLPQLSSARGAAPASKQRLLAPLVLPGWCKVSSRFRGLSLGFFGNSSMNKPDCGCWDLWDRRGETFLVSKLGQFQCFIGCFLRSESEVAALGAGWESVVQPGVFYKDWSFVLLWHQKTYSGCAALCTKTR